MATARELAAAGALENPDGQTALILAERIDAGAGPGAGLAALSLAFLSAYDRALGWAEARENVVPIGAGRV